VRRAFVGARRRAQRIWGMVMLGVAVVAALVLAGIVVADVQVTV
jgi:hypothetical protein